MPSESNSDNLDAKVSEVISDVIVELRNVNALLDSLEIKLADVEVLADEVKPASELLIGQLQTLEDIFNESSSHVQDLSTLAGESLLDIDHRILQAESSITEQLSHLETTIQPELHDAVTTIDHFIHELINELDQNLVHKGLDLTHHISETVVHDLNSALQHLVEEVERYASEFSEKLVKKLGEELKELLNEFREGIENSGSGAKDSGSSVQVVLDLLDPIIEQIKQEVERVTNLAGEFGGL